MPKNPKQKQKLLYIMKFFMEKTDDDYGVTVADIIDYLEEYGITAERKSIYSDIECLRDFGFDIVKTKVGKISLFSLVSRDFSLEEIKLLIDAVSSSRFITKEKSEVLIGKLTGLVSDAQAEKIRRHLYLADRVKADNKQIYYIVDVITDAINEGRKICFQYFEFNGAKEKILRREGTKYSVSPYALVWDDNHYYMIGFSDTRQMMVNFRVDRMCSTELTNERAVPLPAGFDMAEYVQHQFRMFAGDEIDVVLECRDDMMKYIIDQFGEKVETWPAAEGAFYAKVSVADSPTFYGWVFPFEGKVRIKSPLEIREKYRKMVSAAAQEQP